MDIKRLIEKIEERYDPEYDVGIPEVTYIDLHLLQVIKLQQEQIQDLERKLERLANRVANIDSFTLNSL